MTPLNGRPLPQTPSALRTAAQHLRNQRSWPPDVTDALRMAVAPENRKDLWHAVPAEKLPLFEDVYDTVMRYYDMAISRADKDPELADVLDNLAERAELEIKRGAL